MLNFSILVKSNCLKKQLLLLTVPLIDYEFFLLFDFIFVALLGLDILFKKGCSYFHCLFLWMLLLLGFFWNTEVVFSQ